MKKKVIKATGISCLNQEQLNLKNTPTRQINGSEEINIFHHYLMGNPGNKLQAFTICVLLGI